MLAYPPYALVSNNAKSSNLLFSPFFSFAFKGFISNLDSNSAYNTSYNLYYKDISYSESNNKDKVPSPPLIMPSISADSLESANPPTKEHSTRTSI